MKITSRFLLAAVLAAAPVTSVAQTTAPPAEQGEREHPREGRRGEMRGPREGRGGPGGSPVQGLLRQREQLGLTAEQVARLEAVDRDLQARNAPLHQQLQALRPQGARGVRPDSAARGERRQRGERPRLTAEQRQQMEQRRAQAEPIRQQLRQNTEAALTQARGVLTARQQEQVRQRLEQRRERGRRGPGGERGKDGPRGGRPGDGGTQRG